eukprot:2646260-Prymnesium_polylepis.1
MTSCASPPSFAPGARTARFAREGSRAPMAAQLAVRLAPLALQGRAPTPLAIALGPHRPCVWPVPRLLHTTSSFAKGSHAPGCPVPRMLHPLTGVGLPRAAAAACPCSAGRTRTASRPSAARRSRAPPPPPRPRNPAAPST